MINNYPNLLFTIPAPRFLTEWDLAAKQDHLSLCAEDDGFCYMHSVRAVSLQLRVPFPYAVFLTPLRDLLAPIRMAEMR